MAKSDEELKEYLLKALKTVAPEIDVTKLHPEKNLRRQMRIDSIDFLKIVLIINKDTGFTVPESDYRKLFTLNGLMDYFRGKI